MKKPLTGKTIFILKHVPRICEVPKAMDYSLTLLLGITQMARFMWATWDPSGSCWPQEGLVLAPRTLLSGYFAVVLMFEESVMFAFYIPLKFVYPCTINMNILWKKNVLARLEISDSWKVLKHARIDLYQLKIDTYWFSALRWHHIRTMAYQISSNFNVCLLGLISHKIL